jgi:Uma2 family endonuclease
VAVQDKVYSVAEFLAIAALPENASKRLELVKGVIIDVAPSSPTNTVIAARFVRFLGNFVDEHDLGYVTGADGGYIVSAPDNVFVPDAAFISKSRAPGLPEKVFPVAPDLAIEVISPSERPRQILDKVNAYLRGGTRLVWTVYPEDGVIDVYQPGEEGGAHVQTLGVEDVLEGGEVLPGLKLPVSEIFKGLQ